MPTPARYRMYRIKTVVGADDPASMAEVIRRRFSRAQRSAKRCRIWCWWMADYSVAAARAELDALGLPDVRVAGIAERFEELYHDPRNAAALLWFAADSPALRVIQRIRDEAHRFALTYHRKLRTERIRESILMTFRGLAPSGRENCWCISGRWIGCGGRVRRKLPPRRILGPSWRRGFTRRCGGAEEGAKWRARGMQRGRRKVEGGKVLLKLDAAINE